MKADAAPLPSTEPESPLGLAFRAARSLLFTTLFYGWTVFLCFTFFWVLFLPKPALFRSIRIWQGHLVWIERWIGGMEYRVLGRKHVPGGPCIIAAKHQSAWETCKLHLMFGDPAIVLKEELLRMPIWGAYARRSGMIPINRAAGKKALEVMLSAARKARDEGRKIVIFPQGTRLPPGVKKPYKIGVGALYEDLGIPVVPMALNSGLFWPKKGLLKRPGVITIAFLPPIPPGLTRDAMMQELEDRLESESDRLAGLEGRSEPRA